MSDEAWRDWVMSAAWCLEHLGHVLAAAANEGREALAELRDRQLALMEDIEGRLDSLAHDSSHGRRDRLTADVRASVGQAANLLAGDG